MSFPGFCGSLTPDHEFRLYSLEGQEPNFLRQPGLFAYFRVPSPAFFPFRLIFKLAGRSQEDRPGSQYGADNVSPPWPGAAALGRL
jgi:hypothetical protein